MRLLYLEPANDWTDQTVEERLRICAETLLIHHLINDRRFNQILASITQRADRQRDLRARNRRPNHRCARCGDTGSVDHAGLGIDPCDLVAAA